MPRKIRPPFPRSQSRRGKPRRVPSSLFVPFLPSQNLQTFFTPHFPALFTQNAAQPPRIMEGHVSHPSSPSPAGYLTTEYDYSYRTSRQPPPKHAHRSCAPLPLQLAGLRSNQRCAHEPEHLPFAPLRNNQSRLQGLSIYLEWRLLGAQESAQGRGAGEPLAAMRPATGREGRAEDCHNIRAIHTT